MQIRWMVGVDDVGQTPRVVARTRTYVQDDDVEALTTEYIQAHARVVSIPGCDKPVQVFVHVEGSNRWVP